MGAFMVVGCVGLGFILPDILFSYSGKVINGTVGASIVSAISCGSIAAYFVF